MLAVDPDRDVTKAFWPSRAILPQGEGDLGRRMQRLFASLPPGPVVIVGSDIPAIRAAHIAAAFKLLGGADAVLGPARDGGYWLVGLKRSPRVLRPFAGVRWSSAYALADTVANLDGKRVAFAAMLSDVDAAEDYRRERASARPDRLEIPAALDAAGVVGDRVAEPAFVIEPEAGALDADHVHADADIADHVVGRGGDAECAHP